MTVIGSFGIVLNQPTIVLHYMAYPVLICQLDVLSKLMHFETD